MPHLPDDDGFEPPLKVLRKRFNGVYREDHGLSGPARRYILLVAMLVALASVPTLAVITIGTREIAGRDRSGAMDAPFLPPPVTGPVRPSPKTQNHSAYDHPGRPPSVSVQPSTASPGVSPPMRTSDPIPTVPGLPAVPDDEPAVVAARPRSHVDDRPKPADKGVSRPQPVAAFPTVPGLPAVPDDDWAPPLARRVPDADSSGYDDSSWDKADSSDNGDSDDDSDAAGDQHATNVDIADHNGPSTAEEDPSADEETPSEGEEEPSADEDEDHDKADHHGADHHEADHDQGSEDPDPDDSPHHECEAAFRSTIADRPRTGPASAGGQE